MRRRIAIELVVVAALLALAGFVWFFPATRALVAGDATVMIGDASDSITNVWQYQLVVDTLRSQPWRLFFGALYTDQVTHPDGYAVFIPYSERVIVLALSAFMRVESMPTAVVWVYVVLSGLAMHGCARLFGWSRTVSFALALAWAISPYTRARSECHIALVGVYFAPAVVAATRILAGSPRALGWSSRTDLAVASLLFFAAAGAAHYYLMLLVGFAPVFALLHALLLPRGAPRLRAAGRLGVALLPALAIVATTSVAPLPPGDAKAVARTAPPAAAVQVANSNSLRIYGAHAVDYVAGDVRFGDRDVLGLRAALTRDIRKEVLGNLHERTNGIRWTILAACVALAVAMAVTRTRRRLRDDERRLAVFAFVLGVVAFAMSVGPGGIRHHDKDIGPVLLLARIVPPFRVANRVGVLVHFAALLGAGVVFSALSSRSPRGSRMGASFRRALPGAALLGLVIVEYLPLHPVITAPVAMQRASLDPPDGACGAGITVPYVTFGFQADHYYWTMAELRGTSCKLIHAGYLSDADEALRAKLSTRQLDDEARERALEFARCTRARWAIFRLDAPEPFRQSFCSAMGWSFVSPDACRGAPSSEGPPRTARECIP